MLNLCILKFRKNKFKNIFILKENYIFMKVQNTVLEKKYHI